MTEFAASKMHRRAIVDVVNVISTSGMKIALMTDVQTKGQFTVPMSAPGRINPQEGDIWQLSKETGYWAFDKLIAKSQETVVSTVQQAFDVAASLGIFEYMPDYVEQDASGDVPIEMPVGAHIGQIRFFYGLNGAPGWLKCDGSLKSRLRYRRLYNRVGTTFSAGDGSTTFGLPLMNPLVLDNRAGRGYKLWDHGWGLLDSTGFFSFQTSGTAVTTGADRSITTRAGRVIQADFNTSDHFGDTLGDTYNNDFTMDSTTVVAGTAIQVSAANHYIPPGLVRRFYTATTTSHRFRSLCQRVAGTGTFFHRGYVALFDVGQNGSPPATTDSIWPYIYAGGL